MQQDLELAEYTAPAHKPTIPHTFVLEPGRAPKVLAVNRLDDGCMASPAVADGALFVRTMTHLYCIQER